MRESKLGRGALRAIWFGFVPAALSALVFQRLIPGIAFAGPGPLGRLAKVAHAAPVLCLVTFFVLISMTVRFWSARLPGARYLAEIYPAENPAFCRRALGLALSVAAAGALGLALRARIFGVYTVLSGSMLPTLCPGDQILGSKLAYRLRGPGDWRSPWATMPRRGDVIVFPTASVRSAVVVGVPELLVKRVFGLPGDRVGLRATGPTINGWTVPSCDAGEYLYVPPGGEGSSYDGRLLVEWLEDRSYLTVRTPLLEPFEDYEVKPGEVFVLGDNRNNSLDSRAWNAGHGAGVPVARIDAIGERFVVGVHRDGEADFGRLLTPLSTTRLHLEGIDAHLLEEGIAKCLIHRPAETYPPPPAVATPSPVRAAGT